MNPGHCPRSLDREQEMSELTYEETEQDRLNAMIEQFEQQEPELARVIAEAPVLPLAGPATRYEASVRSGTSTESTGLAFVGSGTGRAR